ncbi:hypothetical protein F5X68DRAFT_41017 [Plectosphaerella plurivora]|uniref:Uncharacterized protein n=1 Tax=Plectosphaerella plurivora TaxID=936078 RepID=A0A9P9A748_9PEZI|nr:hypothetical protein F5X68DRAFT_41017 [Plectosphaerella plurivora]
MDDVSNARPLAIFSGYMILAASLTAACISIIRGGAARSQRQNSSKSNPRQSRTGAVIVFSLLAIISLATTWTYMFRFFSWSYQQWALAHPEHDPDTLHLGRWLRDTTLFKQAWASTLETAPRSWWSLQIFGFCGVWSVKLACQARNRRIPHMWLFMLLGQVVAISFASNLFFLAVLLHDVVPAKQPQSPPSLIKSASLWYDVLLAINIALSTMVPAQFGKPGFMRFLLAPHLLAFAPLVLNRFMPESAAPHGLSKPWRTSKALAMFMLLFVGTAQLYEEGADLGVALKTLHEHPAVGSVGWDVICCWTSYVAWELLGVE